MFTDRISEIEYACYLLAGDTEVEIHRDNGRIDDGLRREDSTVDLRRVLAKKEMITAHATNIWEDRRPHLRWTCLYIGFSEG